MSELLLAEIVAKITKNTQGSGSFCGFPSYSNWLPPTFAQVLSIVLKILFFKYIYFSLLIKTEINYFLTILVLQKDPLSGMLHVYWNCSSVQESETWCISFILSSVTKRNCVVWGSPQVQRSSVSVLKTCRVSPVKLKVFCACCVYQLYFVEPVLHPVHTKWVLSMAKAVTLYDALIILH